MICFFALRKARTSAKEARIWNKGQNRLYGAGDRKGDKRLFGRLRQGQNTTGTSLTQLCGDYIDKDIPVMVWATIAMIEVEPRASWYLRDGTLFTWLGNEHCLVLTGYDSSYYYFNDPYKGTAVKYAGARVEDRFEKLGKQSLVVLP